MVTPTSIPPEPHIYIENLGFAEVYLFFYFLLQNIDCGYSLECVPIIYVLTKNKKNIKIFLLKIFIFTTIEILHGHVFVMCWLFSDMFIVTG